MRPNDIHAMEEVFYGNVLGSLDRPLDEDLIYLPAISDLVRYLDRSKITTREELDKTVSDFRLNDNYLIFHAYYANRIVLVNWRALLKNPKIWKGPKLWAEHNSEIFEKWLKHGRAQTGLQHDDMRRLAEHGWKAADGLMNEADGYRYAAVEPFPVLCMRCRSVSTKRLNDIRAGKGLSCRKCLKGRSYAEYCSLDFEPFDDHVPASFEGYYWRVNDEIERIELRSFDLINQYGSIYDLYFRLFPTPPEDGFKVYRTFRNLAQQIRLRKADGSDEKELKKYLAEFKLDRS